LKFTRCNFTRRNWPEELLTPRHKYFGYFTFHCVSATKMVRTVTIGLSSAMHLSLSMKKRRIARLIMMSKTKRQYRNSQRYRHRLVWSVRMNSLNALEFRRRYRLSKILFQRLITKMRPHYSKVERSIDLNLN
jgi:hypothetical protein